MPGTEDLAGTGRLVRQHCYLLIWDAMVPLEVPEQDLRPVDLVQDATPAQISSLEVPEQDLRPVDLDRASRVASIRTKRLPLVHTLARGRRASHKRSRIENLQPKGAGRDRQQRCQTTLRRVHPLKKSPDAEQGTGKSA